MESIEKLREANAREEDAEDEIIDVSRAEVDELDASNLVDEMVVVADADSNAAAAQDVLGDGHGAGTSAVFMALMQMLVAT